MTPLEQLCLQRGLRLTEHRRIILEILEAATDHPSAREIHHRAAVGHRIGLATVYRALNSLAAVGVVTRRTFPDGTTRYEGAGTRPHHHLIDVATGMVVEIEDSRLAAIVEAAARHLGYRLVDYRLKVFGKAKHDP